MLDQCLRLRSKSVASGLHNWSLPGGGGQGWRGGSGGWKARQLHGTHTGRPGQTRPVGRTRPTMSTDAPPLTPFMVNKMGHFFEK